MKIGIDISQIVYEGTGVARFTDGLVRAVLEYDKKNEWTFFFSSLRKNLDVSLEKKIISSSHKLIKWRLPPTLLSFLSNDIHNSVLSSFIFHLSSRLDYFITSDWIEHPLQNVKKTTIVHDLSYLRYPETVHESIRKTQVKRLLHVKKESKIIFVDSEATKNDLINFLGIDKKRVVVNYPGVEVIEPTENQIEQTLKRNNLRNKKFILTVGKLEPRKNLSRLIQAFKHTKKKDIKLVIIGPKGWQFNNLTIEQSNNISFLGYIPDEELYSLYLSSLFFIYPSIWEGFGYPVIEAMKLETPVTCSNTSSMKEIAKDSALLFNPLDSEEMYQSINRLIQDEPLRSDLIKKGLQRSKIFTWERYYNTMISTLQSY